MKYFCWLALVSISIFTISTSAQASWRVVRQYRIDERGREFVDRSPYTLTMTSSNLEKYPRSVVTFLVSTEGSRNPSAIEPALSTPARLSGKRHYKMLDDGEFGRSGKSLVVFDREAGTVFIGFIGVEGKKFFYKEITPARPSDLAQRQPSAVQTPDSH